MYKMMLLNSPKNTCLKYIDIKISETNPFPLLSKELCTITMYINKVIDVIKP